MKSAQNNKFHKYLGAGFELKSIVIDIVQFTNAITNNLGLKNVWHISNGYRTDVK